MNRLELVGKIVSAHQGISNAEAARILDTVTSSIVAAVAQGDDVQIIGFGTFKKNSRKARAGFNPRAGERIDIPAQDVPKFVPGSAFRNAVDPGNARRKASTAIAAKTTTTKRSSAKKTATKKVASTSPLSKKSNKA